MKRILIGAVLAAVAVLAVLGLRGRGVPTEVTHVTHATVREYIAEDAKTRLDKDYLIDMPVSGTLERIALEEGDRITKGDVVAQVELFTLEQQIKGMEALIEQARTQITGVDVAKPKSEDLDGADVRARQMRDNLAIAQKERAIVDINYTEAEREFNRVKALFDEGAVSQSSFDEAQRLYKSLGQGR
ncbi:MAG: biotin/lipoyl-binding protein, partial [bacterium]|nr:biotin/lipoyl-binding protein [bacterium]